MIIYYLITEPPQFCPECGYGFKWDTLARIDFYAGCAHSCPKCGSRFQHKPGITVDE